MKFTKVIIALLSGVILLLSVGCSAVTIKDPLSENPEPIDQEKFEGTWLMDDEVFHVKFGSNGVAQIAGMEWESNQFHIVHAEVIVTKGDKHNFLSVRVQEDGEWMDEYFFLSYIFSENGDLVVWSPDVDMFEDKIENGHLQGVITEGKYSTHVSITNSPLKLLKLINDPENMKLFEYGDPTIIRKISEK